VIGEYGDALLRGGQYEEEELVKEVKQSDIVDLFTSILNSSYAGQIVKEYIITAAMKLTTRLTEPAQIERLRRLLESNNANLDVEIQQRAVEYGNLFAYDQVRRGVLERMPPPEIREEQRVLGEATKKRHSKVPKMKKPSQVTEQDMLLDLMGGDTNMPVADMSATINGSQHNADLLADILDGGQSMSIPSRPAATTSPAPAGNMSSIMDLFDTPSTTATPQQPPQQQAQSADLFGGMSSPPPQTQGPPVHTAFDKNGLLVTFQIQRNATAVQIMARFRNTGGFERLTDLGLQAAVPKSQKLQLQGISSSELDGGEEATQQMRIISVQGVSHMAKIIT
jgi:AP-1 complex subunit gamma-1